MGSIGIPLPNRLRGKETPPQHLRHIFLLHRLHAFLALPPEHIPEVLHQALAEIVLLPRGVGGQDRGHYRGAVRLDHRLREVLEESLDPLPPD